MANNSKDRINLNDTLDLLRLLQSQPGIIYSRISEELGISISTVKRMLKKLKHLGVEIRNTGSRKKPCYSIENWGVIDKSQLEQSERTAVTANSGD